MKKYLLSIVFIFMFCQVSFAESFDIIDKGISTIEFKNTSIESGGSTSQPVLLGIIKAKYRNCLIIAFIQIEEDLISVNTQLPYIKFENSSSGLFVKYYCYLDPESKSLYCTRIGYNLNIKNYGSLNMPDESVKIRWYLIKR